MDLKFADVVDDHQIKMDAMRLKIKKIRKYAINQSHRGQGFGETGLRSVGVPPKPRFPHFIGTKLWWDV